MSRAMNESVILSLFDQWNSALKTGDPKQVTALYDDEAILLPTVSNQVRRDSGEIEDYFAHFLTKGPQGKIDQANVRLFADLAINSGVYTFSFSDGSSVQARFTFVYRWNGKAWNIIEHHSSKMPEE